MINRYDPKHFTLICELFNACNLHCDFCVKNVEQPDLKLDLKYIVDTLPKDLHKTVLPELIDRKVDTLLFNIYGGEILMDSLGDEFFDAYRYLRDTFDSMVHQYLPNCKIPCTIVTNAVFEKRDRVLKLLNDLNATLNISYDPTGRYRTSEQKRLAQKNIEFFCRYDKVSMITATMTKPTIEAIISEKDPYLSNLPKDLIFDLSYYLPMNNDNDALMPTDDELFEFFKYCLDHRMFNVSEINSFLTQYIYPEVETHSYCHNARITSKVFGKTIFNNCCYDMVRNFYSKGEQEYFGDNYKYIESTKEEDRRLIGRAKRQCLLCNWEPKCPGMCYIAILWHGMKLSSCPIGRAFDYIDQHPEIIQDYITDFDPGKLLR